MPLKPGPFFRDTCMCGEILREYIDIIHPNSSCGFPARLEFRFGKTTWHRPSPHQAEETCVADRGRGLSQVRGICSVRRQAVPRGRWVVACSNGDGEGFLRASCWGPGQGTPVDEWAEEVAAAAAQAGGDSGWAIVMAAEVQDVDWPKLETELMGYRWIGYGQGGWKWVTE